MAGVSQVIGWGSTELDNIIGQCSGEGGIRFDDSGNVSSPFVNNILKGVKTEGAGEAGETTSAEDLLKEMGVELPQADKAYSDMLNAYNESMTALQSVAQKYNNEAKVEGQHAKDCLDVEKEKFFANNHYEIDDYGNVVMDGNGKPRVVYGDDREEGPGETARERAARLAYENEVSYQADLAAAQNPITAESLVGSGAISQGDYDRYQSLSERMGKGESLSNAETKEMRNYSAMLQDKMQRAQIDQATEKYRRMLPDDLGWAVGNYCAMSHNALSAAEWKINGSAEAARTRALSDQIAAYNEARGAHNDADLNAILGGDYSSLPENIRGALGG